MTSELKAGLFVLLSVAGLAYMTTRITQNRFSFVGTKRYYASIQDATGLINKTKVKMAGLDVGQLIEMELIDKHARIKMEIAADVVVHKDAYVSVKSIGFLGDKYIEFSPGTDNAPILPEGGMIQENALGGGFEQLAQKTTEVLKDIKEITQTLKDSLRGTNEDTPSEEETRLDRILDNLDEFTAGLASLDKLGELSDKLTDSASNIRDITDRVKRGEGTLGKLLTDSETVDKINSTLSGVNKYITKADKLSLTIDAKSAGLVNTGGNRSVFNLLLRPTFDKFYLVGVTASPRGTTSITKTTTTINPDGTIHGRNTVREEENSESSLGLNVQFGKRFWDVTFRLGVFESTGGIGVDYSFWGDKIKLYSEVYRFTRDDYKPQANLGFEAQVYRPLYAWAGGDDVLNKSRRSFLMGAGIRFSDDDLKSLLSAAANAAR